MTAPISWGGPELSPPSEGFIPLSIAFMSDGAVRRISEGEDFFGPYILGFTPMGVKSSPRMKTLRVEDFIFPKSPGVLKEIGVVVMTAAAAIGIVFLLSFVSGAGSSLGKSSVSD